VASLFKYIRVILILETRQVISFPTGRPTPLYPLSSLNNNSFIHLVFKKKRAHFLKTLIFILNAPVFLPTVYYISSFARKKDFCV